MKKEPEKNELKELLTDEVQRKLNDMSDMEVGTDEYKKAAESVNSMIKSRNELDRNDQDRENHKKETRKSEIHKWVDTTIKVVETVTSVVVPLFMTQLVINMEYKDGKMITSEPGRTGLRNLLNLTKRK